ncbi:MAG: hypothetical protein PHT07_23895 [Paludibacter sp.]|nr:hypothetical protein [Paludibacter sp.]
MSALGKSRLNTSRSEFTEFVSGKKPETQARYWREYNKHWATEFKTSGTSPPARHSPEIRGKPSYEQRTEEGKAKAVFQRQETGNRYAIVVKAEFTRGRKKEVRHYSIIKGSTMLDDDDLDKIVDSLQKQYAVGDAKIKMSLVQTVDRWNPHQSRVVF